jgi:Trypsin-co-occurring domain 2
VGTDADSDDWLDVADAISLLRGQILEAQNRVGDSPVRFALDEITVEFEVELVRKRGADGALRFGLFTAGGRGERTSQSTHRVALKLVPRGSGGEGIDIGDDIGDEEPGW